MIYSWNSMSEWDHIILAALAGRLVDPEEWSDGRSILRFIRANRIVLPFKSQRVNVLLEDSYHREFLEKSDAETYRFKMDLFRRWIRREHSIWKAAKEAGLEFRKGSRTLLVAGSIAAAVIAVGVLSWLFILPRVENAAGGVGPSPIGALASPPLEQAVSRVTFKANRGPFRLSVDGQQPLTSEGQGDPKLIVVASMKAGEHAISASLPSGEKVTLRVEVSPERRDFSLRFPAEKPQMQSEAAKPEPAPMTEKTVAAPAVPESPAASPVQAPAQAVVEQAQGILIITTRPSGAEVLIDSAETGKQTPFAERIPAGEHEINLTMEGFKQKSFEVAVEPGKEVTHAVTLEEARSWLLFDVRPTARLSLDGAYILDTPYAKSYPVRAGRHTLTIINEALKVNKTITVDLKEGDTLTIREVLK
jgi:hypothetical protein